MIKVKTFLGPDPAEVDREINMFIQKQGETSEGFAFRTLYTIVDTTPGAGRNGILCITLVYEERKRVEES